MQPVSLFLICSFPLIRHRCPVLKYLLAVSFSLRVLPVPVFFTLFLDNQAGNRRDKCRIPRIGRTFTLHKHALPCILPCHQQAVPCAVPFTHQLPVFVYKVISHEPPALLVVCCWPYWADVTFPPKGGPANHYLVTLPPKGGSINHYLVTGGRLKVALCYFPVSPSMRSLSYCSPMYLLIVSSFTLPTVSQ